MIGHKAIGRNGPIEPMTYFPKQAEEPYPIFIIKINGLTPVTMRSNVVQQACQFESKRSCHKNSIAQSWNARPDPFLRFDPLVASHLLGKPFVHFWMGIGGSPPNVLLRCPEKIRTPDREVPPVKG